MIADEIRYIMQAYGITVDRRHLLLLSDVMTFKGEVCIRIRIRTCAPPINVIFKMVYNMYALGIGNY